MNSSRLMHYLPVGIFMAGALALSFTGCGNSTKSDKAAEAFKTDSVGFVDTLRVDSCVASCSLSVDYPVEGNPVLVSNVRDWMADQMSYSSIVPEENRKVFRGVADGKVFLDSVGGYLLGQAKTDFEEFVKEGFISNYEYIWNIGEEYRTDTYVTFGASSYVYLGGAHGGSSFVGAVFALDSGKQYGWNMFQPDSLSSLVPMIKERLMKDYFEVSAVAEFKDDLLVNPDTLPLPATAPYFLADGVHFIYQQYEIAPYSEGMPGCVIPFSALMDKFTPEVKKLLEKK